MSLHSVYVGIGSNAGDRFANVERALASLNDIGNVARVSSLYRTAPWGKVDQPWFLNAVALIETELSPHGVLAALQTVETQLGRSRSERWGPRSIDLDVLLYDDVEVDSPGLRIPHRYLSERAFVLVPLAEINGRFAAMRDGLDDGELAGVARCQRESRSPMSEGGIDGVSERVRALASFLTENDAVRVRIVRGEDEIEVVSGARTGIEREPEASAPSSTPAQRIDAIKAELVGVFHLGRPAPVEGDAVEGDRELGYVEALGIRTPVHSMGSGRIVGVTVPDGAPVEYGQALFLVARGN